MEVIGLILIGGLAGWIAGTLIRGAGYGLVINIVVGVIGGVIGGKLFALLGMVGDGSGPRTAAGWSAWRWPWSARCCCWPWSTWPALPPALGVTDRCAGAGPIAR